MNRALLSIALLFSAYTSAQVEQDPFSTTGYLGPSFFKPNLTTKGMEYVGDPIGVHANMNGMYFTYTKGQVRPLDSDIAVANTNFNIAQIGYQIGKDFKLGSESFLSASVKPYVAVGAVVGSFPKIRVFENIPSFGLSIAPGIHARISHLNVGVQYDAMGLIHGAFDYDKNVNFGRGFLHGWSFNVGISNSFDILTPEAYTFRGMNVNTQVLKSDYIKYEYKYNDWYVSKVTETTTITTRTPGTRTLTLVSPFFGVGPTYGMNVAQDREASTRMQGVNIGTRIAYFMLDGFYEQGNYGLKDPANWGDIVTSYPIETNFDFSYSLPVTNIGGRFGLNVSKFFTLNSNFEVSGADYAQSFAMVPFSRIHVFGIIGKTRFEKTPSYTYPAAENRIDDFYLNDRPEANFHPDQMPDEAMYLGYGLNIEFGAVYAQWNKVFYRDFPALNNDYYTLGAIIPIGRLSTSLIARRKYKKAWNKGKDQKN